MNHLYRIHRSPEPEPTQDVIKVDVDFDGIKSDVSINQKTQKIEIHAPLNQTPEEFEAWKSKVGNGDKLVALANQKLMETNRMTADAEKTVQQKLQEAETLRLEWLEKNQKMDVAMANLGNANKPSNPTTAKALHEFLGISAEELPDFIANNPAEFSKKQGEYIAEITTNAVNGIRQSDTQTANLNAVKQRAIADNVDFTDFTNFCTQGGATPNEYMLSVYKTIQTGKATQSNKPLLDISKYAIDILPAGIQTVTFDNVTKEMVDKMSDAELQAYDNYLKSKQKG
jgi:hypothetical protein